MNRRGIRDAEFSHDVLIWWRKVLGLYVPKEKKEVGQIPIPFRPSLSMPTKQAKNLGVTYLLKIWQEIAPAPACVSKSLPTGIVVCRATIEDHFVELR